MDANGSDLWAVPSSHRARPWPPKTQHPSHFCHKSALSRLHQPHVISIQLLSSSELEPPQSVSPDQVRFERKKTLFLPIWSYLTFIIIIVWKKSQTRSLSRFKLETILHLGHTNEYLLLLASLGKVWDKVCAASVQTNIPAGCFNNWRWKNQKFSLLCQRLETFITRRFSVICKLVVTCDVPELNSD